MPGHASDLKTGQDSAKAILHGWQVSDSASRERAKDHIRRVLILAFEAIKKHKKISNFTIGYFETIKKKNDPELNELIGPLLETSLYKRKTPQTKG